MSSKISLLLVVTVMSSIIFGVFYSYFLLTISENDKMATNKPNLKSEFESIQKCQCVAFRLDDVQGYWLNEVQIAIIETFQKKNVPLTIGIIGGEKFQFGKDPKISNLIKNRLAENPSFIEIANHGWNHEDFSTIDKKIQSELIKKTNQRLYNILDISPKVFIPPYNKFDNNTIIALQENNITHFSSMLETSNPPYVFEGVSLFHFPETATTGKIDTNLGIFSKIPNQETLDSIKDSSDKYGFVVVTMHPQEFSIHEKNTVYTNNVDWENIKELEILIDKIQKSNLKIVFLSQINQNISGQTMDLGNEMIMFTEYKSYLNYLILGIPIGILLIILLVMMRNKIIQQKLIDMVENRGE